mmetsp:Transcript_44002/g.128117  ORF Transcript_44002/g.128117 Transcript_44002/m.128117 type:complete len:395 (+) Transcript_44002:1109-2293(+)
MQARKCVTRKMAQKVSNTDQTRVRLSAPKSAIKSSTLPAILFAFNRRNNRVSLIILAPRTATTLEKERLDKARMSAETTAKSNPSQVVAYRRDTHLRSMISVPSAAKCPVLNLTTMSIAQNTQATQAPGKATSKSHATITGRVKASYRTMNIPSMSQQVTHVLLGRRGTTLSLCRRGTSELNLQLMALNDERATCVLRLLRYSFLKVRAAPSSASPSTSLEAKRSPHMPSNMNCGVAASPVTRLDSQIDCCVSWTAPCSCLLHDRILNALGTSMLTSVVPPSLQLSGSIKLEDPSCMWMTSRASLVLQPRLAVPCTVPASTAGPAGASATASNSTASAFRASSGDMRRSRSATTAKYSASRARNISTKAALPIEGPAVPASCGSIPGACRQARP